MNTKKLIKVTASLLFFALFLAYFMSLKPEDKSYPGLRQGGIFISDEDFYGDGKMFLEGEWEFYFGEILDSAGFDAKEQKNYYVLPDYWQRDWNDASVEINGHGSYRVRISFQTPKETVSLFLPWVFGAYEAYANGRMILKCGAIGRTPGSESPDVRSKSTVIPLGGDSLELIVHISGQISGMSGLMLPVAIGSNESVSSYVEKLIANDALFIGCFFIMGFCNLAFFLSRRKDKATLCFALFCLAAILRQGTLSYGLLYSALPPDNGFVAYDIYILAIFWLVTLFALFSYYLFGEKHGVGKWHVLFLLACCVGKTAVEFLHSYDFSFPSFYFGNVIFAASALYIFRVLYLVYRHKEKYRYLYTYGAAFWFLANFAENLSDFGFIRVVDLFGNMSFVMFVFIQTVIVARMYTDFSYENERLLNNLESLVEERTAELAEANERLRLMERTRSELISNISHDLRTPMTAIKGYLQLMMEEGAEGSRAARLEYAESANARADQIESLIKDLFLLTRLTEKSIPMNIEPIGISELLSSYHKNYKAAAGQKKIELVLRDDAGNVTVHADRSFLNRIMDNLILNALYHAGSKIEIRGYAEDEAVILSVADDGAGIDAETLPHVFERFYKKRTDGAGLGLSIVRGLTLALGGEVFAESVPGLRTEFGVKLKS